ncbi:MAG: hypothetical protein LBI61_02025 [Puniceicoccales bacterium]|nr:hypothetical protein [Puniceicoccales bacterium]
MREIMHFHRLRSGRIKFFRILTAVTFAYLLCGLFLRQIVQFGYFRKMESQQSLRRVILLGTRGNIYDRNGVLLAGRGRIFSINLHLGELQGEFRKWYMSRANAIGEAGGAFDAKNLRRTAKEEVVRKYLSVANETLGSNYEISGTDIERHLAGKFLLPMKVAENISKAEYEKLVCALPKDSPVQPTIEEVRHYPCGELACHVIGYVAIGDDQFGEQESAESVKTFVGKRQVGRTGVELAKDDVLRGTPGYELWQVDTLGRNRDLLKAVAPKHGASVTLSIDGDLQSVAEMALGGARSCAVAMDVRTGEILVMASKPAYDVNSFVPRISHGAYDEIAAKSALINLAIQGKFPLGPVFELISAVAFLKSGEILRTDSIFCSGTAEIGGRKFFCKNHSPEMAVTFRDAIALGCGTFFREGAKRAKNGAVVDAAVAMGLSEKSGIELPYEGSGSVPIEEAEKLHGGGDAVNLSTARSHFLATPLEVCCLTASIAANRLRTRPTIFFCAGGESLQNGPDLGLSEDDYKFFVDSMVIAAGEVEIDEGGELLSGIGVAGKGGMAQFFDGGKSGNLWWFTCFAPAHDPRIAATVVVQESGECDPGGDGRSAALVAMEILREYFSKNELLKTAEPIDSTQSVDGSNADRDDSQ